MLNLILSVIFISTLPVFMLGNIFENYKINSSQNTVLGEATRRNEIDKNNPSKNYNNFNSFPLDFLESGPTPIRKEGYRDIKIWSGSSVVIDEGSGTILEYDNGRKRTQIASLTKLMTAVLVVENIDDFDEEVTITREALSVPGTVVGCPASGFCNGNRMYTGEKITVENLLKAMLLNSANDAATALGIYIGGSTEKFVDMMNEKAENLGLKDSHFCTPSGLEIDGEEDNCYSSAYDIARIAAYSLEYDLIWNIMRIEEGRFYSTDGSYMHELKNTDILVSEIPNCIGGKTGFTPLAGKSLLLAVHDPEKKYRVIAVILNDEDRWTDMRNLICWVFDNYEWR